MKKILIALDYNPSAKKVAETGFDLAKSMNARAILFHAVSDVSYYSSLNYSPVMGFDSFGGITEVYNADKLKEGAEKYLDKIKDYLGNEKIETVVRSGSSGETILETATELKADIIVMGTHSRSGFEKLLVGSVAEKVLHHSQLPLYIIPTKDFEEK
jgi:nucleotide-binding universal stress UspA family protein